VTNVRPAIFWLVVAAAGTLACGALAAPLVLSSGKVADGNTSVVDCDEGLTSGYTTTRGKVTAVTIGGIADPACEGGTLRVTVTDSSGAALTSAEPQFVPADGDTLDDIVTLTTSTQPSASLVAGINVVIEGP
jgi:hypothetical protein